MKLIMTGGPLGMSLTTEDVPKESKPRAQAYEQALLRLIAEMKDLVPEQWYRHIRNAVMLGLYQVAGVPTDHGFRRTVEMFERFEKTGGSILPPRTQAVEGKA